MKKFISITLSCILLFLNTSVYAQDFGHSARAKDLSVTIINQFSINNTGYKSKGTNTVHIPAQMRYIHSDGEINYRGIHGLYPAPYSIDVNNTLSAIREFAAIDRNSDRVERVLNKALYNSNIHEAVYIESLLALYKLQNLEPGTRKLVKDDLTFLTKFADHELIAGIGKEADSALRKRINTTLGRSEDDALIKKSDLAQFNVKRAEVANFIGIAGLVYGAASFGMGFKGSVKGVVASTAPKGNANLKVIQGGGNTTGAQFGKTIKMRPSTQSGDISASAYNGNAAVKIQPEISPMRVIKTQPAQPVTATNSYMAKVRSVTGKTTPAAIPPAKLAEGKTSAYIGDPITPNSRRLTKEEVEQRINRGLEVSEKDLMILLASDSFRLRQKAMQRGLLKETPNVPLTSVLGITNNAESTQASSAEAPSKFMTERKAIESNQKALLDKADSDFKRATKSGVYSKQNIEILEEVKDVSTKILNVPEATAQIQTQARNILVKTRAKLQEIYQEKGLSLEYNPMPGKKSEMDLYFTPLPNLNKENEMESDSPAAPDLNPGAFKADDFDKFHFDTSPMRVESSFALREMLDNDREFDQWLEQHGNIGFFRANPKQFAKDNTFPMKAIDNDQWFKRQLAKIMSEQPNANNKIKFAATRIIPAPKPIVTPEKAIPVAPQAAPQSVSEIAPVITTVLPRPVRNLKKQTQDWWAEKRKIENISKPAFYQREFTEVLLNTTSKVLSDSSYWSSAALNEIERQNAMMDIPVKIEGYLSPQAQERKEEVFAQLSARLRQLSEYAKQGYNLDIVNMYQLQKDFLDDNYHNFSDLIEKNRYDKKVAELQESAKRYALKHIKMIQGEALAHALGSGNISKINEMSDMVKQIASDPILKKYIPAPGKVLEIFPQLTDIFKNKENLSSEQKALLRDLKNYSYYLRSKLEEKKISLKETSIEAPEKKATVQMPQVEAVAQTPKVALVQKPKAETVTVQKAPQNTEREQLRRNTDKAIVSNQEITRRVALNMLYNINRTFEVEQTQAYTDKYSRLEKTSPKLMADHEKKVLDEDFLQTAIDIHERITETAKTISSYAEQGLLYILDLDQMNKNFLQEIYKKGFISKEELDGSLLYSNNDTHKKAARIAESKVFMAELTDKTESAVFRDYQNAQMTKTTNDIVVYDFILADYKAWNKTMGAEDLHKKERSEIINRLVPYNPELKKHMSTWDKIRNWFQK